MIAAAAYRPFEGERRVFVIAAAEAMAEESQNALLKTLEEPAPFAHLILITSEPEALLETVRSRCRPIRFAPLAAAAAAEPARRARPGLVGGRAARRRAAGRRRRRARRAAVLAGGARASRRRRRERPRARGPASWTTGPGSACSSAAEDGRQGGGRRGARRGRGAGRGVGRDRGPGRAAPRARGRGGGAPGRPPGADGRRSTWAWSCWPPGCATSRRSPRARPSWC